MAAIAGILHHGDVDGDGFVEYERSTPHSLVNQGWKDSWDAVRHPDGELAQGPIALCEVQGYAYAAFLARAHLAHDAGDDAAARTWRERARQLRRRFNEEMWLDDEGWFALGLDGDKRPIRSLASNMGHCLWTGIVDADKAARVAQALVSDDLFSGWGVRTLGRSMTAFNPVSYHNGSVWPHDNALCISGLVRYGFVEEAHRILEGQLAAAAATDGRLPELFAGFDRGRPAAYPTSCSPQAWASASPLLWLRALLRFDPWSGRDAVYVDPILPPWIEELSVDGIDACGGQLRVAVDPRHVEVTGAGRCEVVRAPRPPLDDLPGLDDDPG
ncbi:amylo-alpha-1,6-glucosidase [Actinomarinicola tropica]|uniref:Mannosylglycerate hydrolase MGH1-like glycoside hydrolase domain-containing protein n=1 Tax=Actinomarinicola tropica TaxID=2789776 RepID=A0A5Q2RIQ0_9ACTN|nr:amylo-alpha-1,6-glucosidase [Actinomarinicola tropica]QGG95404.1 hypothetical protein GH723_10020 [Actinomarinicola tropica]